MKKLAFTLAEIMIVLMVIGILTAILLPSARQAMPNENVMKFKKGHNALLDGIRELVYSDKYYLNGDLAVKPDGTLLSSSVSENRKYLCQSLAEVITTKEVNCSDYETEARSTTITNNGGVESSMTGFRDSSYNGSPITSATLEYSKNALDTACTNNISLDIYKQIVTNDGIWFYDNAPGLTMGVRSNGIRQFSSPEINPASIRDENGFDTAYKIICMDIDGIPSNATKTNCVNECPFGYGLRADGKILTSTRVDEWLKKSIQEKD